LREGAFNIARYLPTYFIPPELGPKLYSAYGMLEACKFDEIEKTCLKIPTGSTLCHVDSADACNVLCHVAELNHDEWRIRSMCKLLLVDENQVDECIKNRETKKLGAVWHIFHSDYSDQIRRIIKMKRLADKHNEEIKKNAKKRDADSDSDESMEDLQKKREIKAKKEAEQEKSSDPIHDQMQFIDPGLLRMIKSKNIPFAAFIQCEGDAVFIPSGAIHQVVNINSCIKSALDFVAAERLENTMKTTYEYSKLSENHANHADKVQLKSTVFHTAKEIVQCINKIK
jgi:lysine-specific demethylase 3